MIHFRNGVLWNEIVDLWYGNGLLGTFAMYKAFAMKNRTRCLYSNLCYYHFSSICVWICIYDYEIFMAKINKQNTMETIRKENI